MAYSEAVLNAARETLARERQERTETYESHLRTAYERCPELRLIDTQLRASVAEATAAAFRRNSDTTEAIAKIKERNLELQERRRWLILNNFEEDFLDDTPVCTRCGGIGYVGAEMCECLHSLCQQEQKKRLSVLIGTGRERFSAFRADYYSSEYNPSLGTSDRDIMENNLRDCKAYANNFSLRSGNLLFTGKTGLGKTFLSGCIARVVSEKGFSVVYDTVVRMISDYENVKFGENTDETRRALNKYRDCDLLIIDDLGTEMLTQFSMSALYTLINDRLLEEKPTIISTNLTPAEIQSRYSPQISSRLRGCFDILYFSGTDIRLKGKL